MPAQRLLRPAAAIPLGATLRGRYERIRPTSRLRRRVRPPLLAVRRAAPQHNGRAQVRSARPAAPRVVRRPSESPRCSRGGRVALSSRDVARTARLESRAATRPAPGQPDVGPGIAEYHIGADPFRRRGRRERCSCSRVLGCDTGVDGHRARAARPRVTPAASGGTGCALAAGRWATRRGASDASVAAESWASVHAPF
jgi:hypothetical protein